ncbi:glucose-6-phosphate dehydrogenase assembly protein OpcA [Candidatus Poribacteria bacterium]|nr:glucose-6-phosphate dehydrogenase assembly protein OpcA [Candidatus Poribacteria bacterium]
MNRAPIPMQDFVTGVPVELSPAAIERELASMWERRAESGTEEAAGVTRITLGNVLWLGTSRHVPRIRQTFARLVVDYPCRLFLMEFISEHDGPGIDAYVNAYCFLAGGPHKEVCCEEIHLRFGPRGLDHLPGAILPLLVPDVPSCLWHFTAEPWRYERMIGPLTAIVDRTVCEVAFFDKPFAGLRDLASNRSQAHDLAWFRYAPIREQVASLFDDPAAGDLLKQVRTVRAGWAGAEDDPHALVACSLLVGWLAAALGWKPWEGQNWPFQYESAAGPITVEFFAKAAKRPEDRAGIILFEMECAGGESIRLEVGDQMGQMERIIEGSAAQGPCAPRYVHTGALTDAQALGQALNAPESGALFRSAAAHGWPLLRAAAERTGRS